MKLETLKLELEAKLEAYTNNASAKVWYYKFREENEERLAHWTKRRTTEFHRMMTIKKMSTDQFRLALHNNEYRIQSVLFNNN